ncbi:DMT family transporter [Amycolatopsis sp. EV170708-02-1]|uniref:DMT family transporter n=1 Tax=Amycolatopsis sp. EV170708-02-1 TaxID=2919322 RepID=UPI001F0C3320|nr:DMT family transporter [Amycolatopsis sp. EV170708-02-1]UMP06752.1 DMT family transporter [Amycolatopsis sp. EV170708-02-1]
MAFSMSLLYSPEEPWDIGAHCCSVDLLKRIADHKSSTYGLLSIPLLTGFPPGDHPQPYKIRDTSPGARTGRNVSVLLALAASVLAGTGDFLGALLSRRVRSVAVVGMGFAVGLLFLTAVAVPLAGGFAGPSDWVPWAAAAGISAVAGLGCYFAALSAGSMGVVAPIGALGAIIPVLAGMAMGERFGPVTLLGIVLSLAGVAAASGPKLQRGTGSRPVILAAAAAIFFGLTLTFIARGATTSAVLTLWGMRLAGAVLVVLIAVVKQSVGGVRGRYVVPIVLVGLADAGASLLFAFASQRGYIGVTAVLSSLYPVVTVLLARTIANERLAPVQAVGVVGTFLGVALTVIA